MNRRACALAARSAAWWWVLAFGAAILHLRWGWRLLFAVYWGAVSMAVTCYRIWCCLAWLETQ